MASTQVSNGVFISYRRRGGSEVAQVLKEFLTTEGFDVFLDVVKLRARQFDKQLLDQIERHPNFLFIHSKGAFSRCKEPKDWVRKELACALKSKRRIIPILLKGASFPKPGSLPRILAEFEQHRLRALRHFFKTRKKNFESRFARCESESDGSLCSKSNERGLGA